MTARTERYLVDEHGNRVAVVIEIEAYQRILDALDELDALRQTDASKQFGGDLPSTREVFGKGEADHHPKSPDASAERLRELAGVISLTRPVSLEEFHQWETDEDDEEM